MQTEQQPAPGSVVGVRQWSERTARSFAHARIANVVGEFRGTMRTTALGGVQVSRVQVPEHVVQRTESHIDPNERSRFVLCVQLEGGRSMITQDGREALLSPGDVSLYDTSRPYTLMHENVVNCIGVVIPDDRVSLAPGTLRSLAATVMPGHDLVTSTSAQAIERFQQGLDELANPTRYRLGQTFVSLFETICMSWVTQTSAIEFDPRSGLRESVLQYIEDRLADPELSPQEIADAHFISLRSLHSLAQHSGASVAGWIRGRRLERCRADLSDPSLAHVTVAEIGARWGFMHPPHFTTVFRTQFGETPSAYRKHALS
jgi:AraC-like DNA-binding protein